MKPWFAALAVALSLSLTVGPPRAQAQEELKYQKRAGRYEGVKPKPVSGYDIELLSARVDYLEDSGRVGDRLALRFYLPAPTEVYLQVREIEYRHYYWLDRVEPKTPWRTGFGNVFDWPTQDVIRRLDNFKLSELGVLARLEKQQPSGAEKVAPVILYQSKYPSAAKAYLFTFSLRDDAKLTASVYREDQPDPVDRQTFARLIGGRAFTVKWNAGADAPPGHYRLVLKGWLVDRGDPIAQLVSFYHQPVVSDR